MLKNKYVIVVLIITALILLLLVSANLGRSSGYEYYEAPSASPTPSPVPSQTATPTPEPVATTSLPSPSPTPANTGEADTPYRLVYTAIGIDASIGPVGVENGAMGVIHSNTVVSWFNLSSGPGQQGNMILAAHRRWKSKDGPFVNLGSSKAGDPVSIMDEQGSSWEYTVEKVERVKYENPPSYVMELEGDERVTMITCIGDFNRKNGTAEERIVVILKPV